MQSNAAAKYLIVRFRAARPFGKGHGPSTMDGFRIQGLKCTIERESARGCGQGG